MLREDMFTTKQPSSSSRYIFNVRFLNTTVVWQRNYLTIGLQNTTKNRLYLKKLQSIKEIK